MFPGIKNRFIVFSILIASLYVDVHAQNVFELDASLVKERARFELPFTGNSGGVHLSVNNIHFEKNGQPWFPLMGEFHYWRFPDTYWEEQIIKMKSAGLQIIATYVYWGAHEKPRNVWNWQGRLNLRRFIMLCQKHDMYVWLRPGPYINADVRGRGFPDWIDKMDGKRTNAISYLQEVHKYFAQLGKQTKGMYYADGGPVIGVQLENEYASGDNTHIANLKSIATKYGINPVYWSVTANTIFQPEKKEVLPLQGAYCYRGWEAGKNLTKDFLFGDDQWIMGMDLGGLYYPLDSFPRATCEQGSGMQETPAVRFIVQASVIEAHAANQYGRGINMLGYFMFQGGTQYPGTEMPNNEGANMPSGLTSYNYQAPLGEFGEVNDSYRYLKMHHLFLNDFGDRLTTMQFVAQPKPVKDPADLTDLRYAGRFNSKGEGFLYICNTQNYRHMTDKKIAFDISFSGNKKMHLPAEETTIKDDRIAAWPVNFEFNGIKINYATANVLCKIDDKETSHLFLYETEGIRPEISIDGSSVRSLKSVGWKILQDDKKTFLLNADKAGLSVTILSDSGRKIIIHLLNRNEAEHAWKYKYGGQEYLIITDANLMFIKNGIEARQLDNHIFTFKTLPRADFVKAKWGNAISCPPALFYQYKVSLKESSVAVNATRINDSAWTVTTSTNLPEQISDVFLNIAFEGNKMSAYMENAVVADQLNIGKPWMVGMKRFLPMMKKKEFKLVSTSFNPFTPASEAAVIRSVNVYREYRLLANF